MVQEYKYKVFQAEVSAIRHCIDVTEELLRQEFEENTIAIYSDSQAAIKAISSILRNLSLSEYRIMSRRGRINVHLDKIPEKSIRYVSDLWHTLINIRWRWMMLNVALVNVSVYLIFAAFFLFDSWLSGDFHATEYNRTCIVGVKNFISFIQLGLGTITTTGNSYTHPTEFCTLGWIVLTCTTLITIIINGAFISVVHSKISRPANKLARTFFSRRAVVSLRNGHLCLILRINDKTGKHWINTRIRIFIVKDKITNEGESMATYMDELTVEPFGENFWPIDVVHKITKDSPLWNVSAKDMFTSRFEILVIVTGSSILTGNTSNSQTSYTSKDIMWGHRFLPCITYDTYKTGSVVHYENFHKTIPQDTPLCSGCRLLELQEQLFNRRVSMD